MKRTALVILLTLGMASLANAAYIPMTFTMSAPATANLNELITVTTTLSGMTGSEEVPTVVDMMVVISGTSSYTEGILTPGPTFDAFVIAIVPPWSNIDLSSDETGPYAGNGDTIMTFTVTGTSVGTLDFGLDDAVSLFFFATTNLGNYSYYDYPVFGPLTVVGASTQVIPEPAALLLLGLGAVMLRRKRRV